MENHPSFQDARILLVEDNPISQELVREILTWWKVDVKIAAHGAAALEILKQDPHFDAVLMDVQMPEMDGYEATAAIRNELSLRRLPIIAMTANAKARDQQRCLQSGMDAYVAKPVDPSILAKTLSRFGLTGQLNPVLSSQPSDLDEVSRKIDMPEQLPGLNVASALKKILNNRRLYLNLIRRFADRYQKDIFLLEELIAQRDWPTARHFLHTLKGLAGNIGAVELEIIARQLEDAIESAPDNLPPQLSAAFEVTFEQALSSIGIIIAMEDKLQRSLSRKSRRSARQDGTDTYKMVCEMEQYLQAGNLAAEDLLAPIEEQLRRSPYSTCLCSLAKAIDMLDTTHALESIRELKALLKSKTKRTTV